MAMTRFDEIQALLETCTIRPECELELQIRCPALAKEGLAREDFKTLLTEMQESEHVHKLPRQDTLDVFMAGSQRGTYFPASESRDPLLIQKTLVSRKRVTHSSGFEFVLTSKKERVLNIPAEAWAAPQFSRAKKRYSFQYDNMSYDFTCVFPEGGEPCFELELELLPNADGCALEIAEKLVGRAMQLVHILRPDFAHDHTIHVN